MKFVNSFPFFFCCLVEVLLTITNHLTNLLLLPAIIEEVAYSGLILPPSDWKTLNHNGKNARITYGIRVICDEFYYNDTCTTFCRPRNDRFGHYACDDKGQKICLQGWTGVTCEEPVCENGCGSGSCKEPGICKCLGGFKGAQCDECVPYPGCKHGFCKKPWDCLCDTNWGGILCDKGNFKSMNPFP